MNEVRCAHCRSTAVTVVSPDEPSHTVTIECLACGKLSTVKPEQFQVDTEDLPQD